MSLLLNMLSWLVITFLPKSKRLLISWPLSAAGQSMFWSAVGFCSAHLILRTSPMAAGAGHPGTQLSAGRHDGAHWKFRDWEIQPQGGDAGSELL